MFKFKVATPQHNWLLLCFIFKDMSNQNFSVAGVWTQRKYNDSPVITESRVQLKKCSFYSCWRWFFAWVRRSIWMPHTPKLAHAKRQLTSLAFPKDTFTPCVWNYVSKLWELCCQQCMCVKLWESNSSCHSLLTQACVSIFLYSTGIDSLIIQGILFGIVV